MNNPLVTIIITCYNQAHLISNAINSVLAQTYKNWECIVVDDGSSDQSTQVIGDFCQKDTRIKLISQPNQGVSAARNKGFSEATGEYIQFLDGDDTLMPQKLEKQLLHFKENPSISVSICDHQHFYVNKNHYEHYDFEKPQPFLLNQLLFKWQYGFSFTNHAVLYMRNIWGLHELPYPLDFNKRSEDWVFHVLTALKGIEFGYLDEILCNYHIYNASYTADVFNSTSSTIYAAFYLKDKLPTEIQDEFIEHTIKKSFNRYLESKKASILRESGNWKLGYYLTFPLFRLRKYLKILG